MANFLVTSPNLLTEGTDSNDLIVLESAAVLGASVYGNAGNDTINAVSGGLAAHTIFNGGEGSDTIQVSGVAFTLGKIAAGQDNDNILLVGLGDTTLTTIHGGKGADTITLSAATAGFGTFANGVINGNEGHDSITIQSGFAATTTRLSLGKGNDTLDVSAGLAFGGSIIGGAGNDRIFGTISGLGTIRVEGDSLADPDAVGNDTITLGGTFAGTGNLVQGGAGADVITISAAGLNQSTVNGNAGHDSISVGATAASTFIGGGAGNDTIRITDGGVSGGVGTVYGGDGTDAIFVSGSAGAPAGSVYGGEGSDTITIGGIAADASNVVVAYSAFSQSNIAATDSINFASASSFVVAQNVVTASTGIGFTNAGASGFTVASGVVNAWGSSVTDNLTAKVTLLDETLNVGGTVAFTAGTNNYLFVQAGAKGSGIENDLLVQLSTAPGSLIVGTSDITIRK
jgi:hypothetical protein